MGMHLGSSLSAGQLVGGCRVVRLLGRGGMGEVYLAEHVALQRPVALKILPPDLESTQRVERFLKEARTCSRIEHPNVVVIHDVGEQDGLYYIVMQYVQGKNLTELIRDHGGPLPWRSAVRLIQLTARGLHAVHSHGLVHRDVKPSNIMLSVDSRVVLMDFGLVREELDSSLTQAGQVVGTPSFMSPEQCRGQALDRRSDVFSLGSTLYCLLTGEPPFRGPFQEVVLQVAGGGRPEPVHLFNNDVPGELSRVVEEAMALRPEDRFQTADAVGRELKRLLRRASRLDIAPAKIREPRSERSAPVGDTACSPESSVDEPRRPDDNVQFTVFQPESIPPAVWRELPAAAYLEKKRPGSPETEAEPLERARRKAVEALKRPVGQIRESTQPSRRAIPQGDELTFLLEWDRGPGGEVLVESNPERYVFRWLEDEHTMVFRIRASAALDGQSARGRLTVFLGAMLVGDVTIRIPVTNASAAGEDAAKRELQTARLYRKIFPSYSHHDRDVVERVENHAEASGDRYLRDCRTLRSGEEWDPRIQELIRDADIFQLFWSTRSMQSENVRREWEYALALNRPGFVRPVYWEEPRPEAPLPRPSGKPPELPPPVLDRLHFQRIVVAPEHRLRKPSSPIIEAPGVEGRIVNEEICLCGAKVPVHVKDHGGTVYCPSCGAEIQVGGTLRGGKYRAAREEPQMELLPLDTTWETAQRRLPWIGAGVGVLAGFLFLAVLLQSVLNVADPPPPPVASPPPNMVRIEGGFVQLGNDEAKLRTCLSSLVEADELDKVVNMLADVPQQRVRMPAFHIDKYEVTNAEYARFLKQTNRTPPEHWGGTDPPMGRADFPAVNVSYDDAEAYATWAGKQLPTREQWVRAYRGDRDWLFPWGDDYDATRANVKGNPNYPSTCPVRDTPRDVSPFGVCNLVGNASEFVRGTAFRKGRTWRMAKGAEYRTYGFVFGIAPGEAFYRPLDHKDQGLGFRCIWEEPQ